MFADEAASMSGFFGTEPDIYRLLAGSSAVSTSLKRFR